MNEKGMLLNNLGAAAFSMYDLQLYLDTHPYDVNALSLYNQHKQRFLTLTAEYERKYGPLTALNGASANYWDWIKGPWPWEYSATEEVR